VFVGIVQVVVWLTGEGVTIAVDVVELATGVITDVEVEPDGSVVTEVAGAGADDVAAFGGAHGASVSSEFAT